MNLVTKETLRDQFYSDMKEGKSRTVSNDRIARVADLVFGAAYKRLKNGGDALDINKVQKAPILSRRGAIKLSGKILNGFEYDFPGRGTVAQRISAGKYSSGNTLLSDWQDLWDATRMDITIRVEANPTVRQFFFNETSTPQATKLMKPTELFPYAFKFTENNGEGQSVNQGQKRGGQYEPIEQIIYATGFTWTLLAELFDGTYDMTRMNDGIALAYAAKKDDVAMSTIIGYTGYGSAGTAKHTAADTTGGNRQEKLYYTISDAIDELGKRKDPVTKKLIAPTGLNLLCATYDANHIVPVVSGLPSVNERKLPGLPAISNVVAYDDTVIEFPNETETYTGVTAGTAYLVKPNRYMSIAIKQALTMEMDAKPDVKTLAREERAWYYVEALFSYGVAYFSQKITLPTW